MRKLAIVAFPIFSPMSEASGSTQAQTPGPHLAEGRVPGATVEPFTDTVEIGASTSWSFRMEAGAATPFAGDARIRPQDRGGGCL